MAQLIPLEEYITQVLEALSPLEGAHAALDEAPLVSAARTA